MRNLELNKNLMDKAKYYIPGGAHTYSKGSDQFPSNAPQIIDRAKGVNLWDVDGNEYTDFAMSLGTVLLGHAYEPVLNVVRAEIEKGVNFVRPSRIEGEVAELVSTLIPCAEMVKFAKNGSDATTAAIRLARAYTGRDFVVRCQNDPFNSIDDWFIGSTVINRGIPKAYRDLTLQFPYNDLAALEKIFDQYEGQVACVMLEPVSMIPPKSNFLEDLKKLCEKKGALLIFDEVVSGFRFSLGGAQEMVGVTPHLAAYGKGMANGFSVSALVGQREFMRIGGIDHDQERVFLMSTTHGGETHSLAAAKKTMEIIRDQNAIKHFWDIGAMIQSGVQKAIDELKADKYLEVTGYACKPGLVIKDENGQISNVARTLFLQETIERGCLAPYIVPSLSHQKEHVDKLVNAIYEALVVMKKAAETTGMKSFVSGEIVKPVFRKFN